MIRTITIRGRTGRYDVPSFVLTQNEPLKICFVAEELTSGVYRAVITHGNAPKIDVSLAVEKSVTLSPEWLLKGNTEPVKVVLQLLDPAQSKVIKNDFYIEPLTVVSDGAGGYDATAEMTAQAARILALERIVAVYGAKLEAAEKQLKDYIDNGAEMFLPEEEKGEN